MSVTNRRGSKKNIDRFTAKRASKLLGGPGHAPPWNFFNLNNLKCLFLAFCISQTILTVFCKTVETGTDPRLTNHTLKNSLILIMQMSMQTLEKMLYKGKFTLLFPYPYQIYININRGHVSTDDKSEPRPQPSSTIPNPDVDWNWLWMHVFIKVGGTEREERSGPYTHEYLGNDKDEQVVPLRVKLRHTACITPGCSVQRNAAYDGTRKICRIGHNCRQYRFVIANKQMGKNGQQTTNTWRWI